MSSIVPDTIVWSLRDLSYVEEEIKELTASEGADSPKVVYLSALRALARENGATRLMGRTQDLALAYGYLLDVYHGTVRPSNGAGG